MHIDAIRKLLHQINETMENLWIEREACRALLQLHEIPSDEVLRVEKAALVDPECRERARIAFAQMRNALLDEATPALIEALEADMPPNGKPN
jgi:hypothetical protein